VDSFHEKTYVATEAISHGNLVVRFYPRYAYFSHAIPTSSTLYPKQGICDEGEIHNEHEVWPCRVWLQFLRCVAP
jgi:hypothetical protein